MTLLDQNVSDFAKSEIFTCIQLRQQGALQLHGQTRSIHLERTREPLPPRSRDETGELHFTRLHNSKEQPNLGCGSLYDY